MRLRRQPRTRRILAALLVALCLPVATPPPASAQEGEENVWSQWWEGVTDRSIKPEIPIAFVITIPAMLIVTPIWLVERAFARLSEGERDDEADGGS